MEPLGHIIPQSLHTAIKIFMGRTPKWSQAMHVLSGTRGTWGQGRLSVPPWAEKERRGTFSLLRKGSAESLWSARAQGWAQHHVTRCFPCLATLPEEDDCVPSNLCCKMLLRLEKLAGFLFHTKLLGHRWTFFSCCPSCDQEGGSCSTPQPAHECHAAPQRRNTCTAAVQPPETGGSESAWRRASSHFVPQLSQPEPALSSRLNPRLKLQAVCSSPRSTHLSAHAHLHHSATGINK